MRRERVSKAYWGVVMIVIGGLFFLRNFGYIDFSFTIRRYWPLILIIVGGSIIIESLTKKKNSKDENPQH